MEDRELKRSFEETVENVQEYMKSVISRAMEILGLCIENSISFERLEELAEADVEGRLVVLPCAVAEEVEYKSAVDGGKARKGKVIAISMLLSESVRRMEMQVMIESGAVITFEKNDFEKGVMRRGKEESEAELEKIGGEEK